MHDKSVTLLKQYVCGGGGALIIDPETSRLQTAFRWCKFRGLGLLPGLHNFSTAGLLESATTYHRLCDSASPVLMATGFVNGKGNFRHPTESTPLIRSPKNLSQVIMSATPTTVPYLVHIHEQGASGQMGEV